MHDQFTRGQVDFQSTAAPHDASLTTPLPYPSGIYRQLVRVPLWLYRLGLGELVNTLDIMVLTTRGRSSGLPRHIAIEYRVHGSKIYLVSAWGSRPDWFQNLRQTPIVTIRRGEQVLSARAHVVDNAGEALRVLHLFRKRAPVFYDALIARLTSIENVNSRTLPDISNQFTIVRLEPLTTMPEMPSVNTDLKWLWGAGAFSLVGWGVWAWSKKRRASR